MPSLRYVDMFSALCFRLFALHALLMLLLMLMRFTLPGSQGFVFAMIAAAILHRPSHLIAAPHDASCISAAPQHGIHGFSS